MPVPLHSIPPPGFRDSLRRSFLGILLLLAFTVVPSLASGPPPSLRIPLEPLGFQTLSSQFLLNGSSMLSLHYVDDRHLLFTFTVRRLLHRLPNDPEDDQDRNIDALLLELPTGRIVARTSWRVHDHGQYLWSLGHGRFLLRIRDTLTTFAPLVNLPTGEPFRERPFLTTAGRSIAALLVSPDASLLIVETVVRHPPAARPKTLFGPTPPPPPEPNEPGHVQINFYRLASSGEASEEVKPRSAGVVRSSNIGNIASTAAGYLVVLDEGRQRWAFDFNTYEGKTKELSPFDSTCRPVPFFVSRSQFIAFGCRTGGSRQMIGGFDMRGQEMWEQNLSGDYISPTMAFAPPSGRFALSRVLVHSSAMPDQPLSSDALGGQTVIVYQIESGKQILRAECSPVSRAGQNFTLSPNGLGFALVHADSIEIYNLPPLTAKEEADVKLAEAAAPEESNAPVHFASSQSQTSEAEAEADPPSQPSGTPSAPDNATSSPPTDPTADQAPPAQSTPPASNAAGDVPPNQPRKPPTLYTLPTDDPHTPNSDSNEPK